MSLLLPDLHEVTLNCGHKRRIRQRPASRMHCLECGHTRLVVKDKIVHTSRARS